MKRNRLAWLSIALIGLSWGFSNIAGSELTPNKAKTAQTEAPILARAIDAGLIRVGISDNGMMNYEYPSTQLSATGPFTVRDECNGAVLLNGQSGDRLSFGVNSAGFSFKATRANGASTLADLKQVQGPILIEPTSANTRLRILNITRRNEVPEYRGAFEIVRGLSSPNKLTAINIVGLEDYLKAVVPNELPMRYGLEAVKAQAVAARNYAIHPREKPWRTFDICDSQLCQVYFGSQSETPGSNQAIADTEGLIGIYDGDPILALFSSSHGGYAEAYSNAFSDPKTKQYPAPTIPYLIGGPDVPMNASLNLTSEEGARQFWTDPNAPSYDVESPYYRWEKRWTRSELEASLPQSLTKLSSDGSTRDFVSPAFRSSDAFGTLKNIKVLARGQSGKAMAVAIETSCGTWTLQKEFLIRKAFSMGGKMLPSGNVVFTLSRDAQGNLTAIRAQGGGFGHGVGLSQLGASWMSKHGYTFPSIVQHYYKGVSLGSIPVTVGNVADCAGAPQAMLTHFGVHQPSGILWIQDGDMQGRFTASPVTLRINEQSFSVAPNGYRTAVDVRKYLKPGAMNTLVLFPDAQAPNRKLKAWIDLYPPQKASTSQVSVR